MAQARDKAVPKPVEIQYPPTVNGAKTISFYWKVSSESNYDWLEFYIDGTLKDRISGTVNWQQKSYNLPGIDPRN